MGNQFHPPPQNEYEDGENPTPWKARYDMVGGRARTRENAAFVEAQPGMSGPPP
jgi:hypothetical protein